MGRKVYWIDEACVDERGHYRPSIVDEDEDFHHPTDYDYGTDYARASEAVDRLNERMGFSKREAAEVVMHSMFPGSRGKTL